MPVFKKELEPIIMPATLGFLLAWSALLENFLYKNYLKKKTLLWFEKYKKHKNMRTNSIRTSERLYYQDKFNSAIGDIKKPGISAKILSILTTALSQ